MIRKKKNTDSKIDTESWMMSYADMVTLLLAMFIVLSSFGNDQTGASLQKGLESWRTSRQFFGLPGLMSNSTQVAQMNYPGPHYGSMSEGDVETMNEELGACLDEEAERLSHLGSKLKQSFDLNKIPHTTALATIDFFEPLKTGDKLLSAKHHSKLLPILPLLGRSGYRLLLVVWATTPSDSALTRAAQQSARLRLEMLPLQKIDNQATSRFLAVGKPWHYKEYQRPVFSVVIMRIDTAAAGQTGRAG